MPEVFRNDGRELEGAVRLIETLLLRETGVPTSKVTIEPRKRVTTDGVDDEIDLFVQIDIGAGYETIALFECRDRKEPADKNDVENLQGKMRRLGAGKGFFVARGFTRSARALAKQQPVVSLHVADDFEGELLLKELSCVMHRLEGAFSTNTAWSTTPVPVISGETMLVFRGQTMTYSDAADILAREAAAREAMKHFDGPDRIVPFQAVIQMGPVELMIDGRTCHEVHVQGHLNVLHVQPTRVVSFNIEGRGRTRQYFYRTPDGDEAALFETMTP